MIAWVGVGLYGLVSRCGWWRIGKYIVAGATSYGAWDGDTLIGRYQSADQAKAACEKDFTDLQN